MARRSIRNESPPPDSGSITVYPRDAAGGPAPHRILIGDRTGLRRPVGIALGSHGLYASIAGDTVLMFAPDAKGNASPAQVLAGPATGLNGPSGLVVDRRGYLYVANSAKSTVTVYAPRSMGNVPPVRTIEPGPKRPWLDRPSALALAELGNVTLIPGSYETEKGLREGLMGQYGVYVNFNSFAMTEAMEYFWTFRLSVPVFPHE